MINFVPPFPVLSTVESMNTCHHVISGHWSWHWPETGHHVTMIDTRYAQHSHYCHARTQKHALTCLNWVNFSHTHRLMNSYSKASVFRLISLWDPVFSLSTINIPNQFNWKPRLWLDFRNNICFDDEMCWELIHVAHAGTASQTPVTTMRVRWALST